MKIKLITAHDKNLLIGKENSLPWSLPEDLEHFKDTTSGNIIVMGKNTYKSLGRPLPNRINAVLSRSLHPESGIELFRDIKSLSTIYAEEKEIYVIGGTEIYKQFLPIADELIVTEILGEFEGDAFFPPYKHLGFNMDMDRSEFNLISKNGLYYNIIYYTK